MSIRVSRQEEVLMRTRALRWTAVLCLFAGSLLHAQDNPLPGFGITGGNNFRTYVYQAPVLAIDQDAPVKWKKDIGTTYNTRRSTFVNFVFDENGDLYFTGYYSTEVANSGVIKISKTDGSFLWASPLTDSIASDLTPIVGSDAVYSARYNNDFPTVYALNKSTGAVIWESDPLPKPVALNMALHNGTIYGVTTRDADLGVSYVFAIRASDGAILHATPIATSGDVTWRNTTLVPDVFGPGEHGLYWNHDRLSGADVSDAKINCVRVSTTAATLQWTNSPIRTAVSYIMYNPTLNVLYSMHWGDYGSTVEAYDPVTGTKKWVARNSELGSSFNGGFYGTHTLKPDGSGFIFAGFGGDVRSISDPGDLGGENLPASQVDWYYDGPDSLGESQPLAALVTDAGEAIFVSGTSAASDPPTKRRIYIQDAQGGGRLQEWFSPDDPAPQNGAYNFRDLTVGPDGTIYFIDGQEGTHGTLYALAMRPFVAPVVAAMPALDTVGVYTEYVVQLEVAGGDPAGRWAKVAGPEGLKVSNTGRVYGWTPSPADVGQTFEITVEAINPGGSGTVSWSVQVNDPLSVLTIKTRQAPIEGAFGTSLASDGTRLYYYRNSYGDLYATEDGGVTWTPLPSAPGGNSGDNGALAYGQGMLITRRHDGEADVLTTYDIETGTWTHRGSRLFGNTGYVVIGGTVYGNTHAAAVNQGGYITIADLDNLDAVTCQRAAFSNILGTDPNWFSRAAQMTAGPGDGLLYGIKNDWVTEPRGTGDRLWRVDPTTLIRNNYFGPNWDDWDHANSTAENLAQLPWEIGYGSAICAVPPGWAGISQIGAEGGLFIVAGRSPANNEGWGPPSSHFAIYDIESGRFLQGNLPAPTGSGTSIAFHDGKVFIKQGGSPDDPYTDVIWVYGPFEVPPPSADLDEDGDVDRDDFNIFQACVSGPAIPYDPQALPPDCPPADPQGKIAADFDRDGVVDMNDFARFQRCYTIGGTADPNCMD